jgi:hypothetical protein
MTFRAGRGADRATTRNVWRSNRTASAACDFSLRRDRWAVRRCALGTRLRMMADHACPGKNPHDQSLLLKVRVQGKSKVKRRRTL